MIACTIVARNYLPYARVLATSFQRHQPDGTFVTLILDALPGEDATGETFRVVNPYEIGLDAREVDRMATIYDVKELATAVKPALLRTLLADGPVTYFDPDIEVFAPLDPIQTLAEQHAIVLTPHTRAPIPRDGRLPDERMILQAGIYNLGFIAIGYGAEPFLDWWGQRLARDCVVDTANALFVDQRWVDFVPALFEHYVLRDPEYNVAYWNLHERSLGWTGERYDVDGRPLRFFHFSGVDVSDMASASAHMGNRPRIYLRDDPTLERIFGEYATKLRAAGFGDLNGTSYRFDRLPSGIRLDTTMRRLFREVLLAAEAGAQEEPPDPFDPETAPEFLAWLQQPDERHARLPRYLAALHGSRGDLRAAFPDPDGGDYHAFVRWASTAGLEQGVSPFVLPALEAQTRVAAHVEHAGRRVARRVPGARRVVRKLRARGTAVSIPAQADQPIELDIAAFPVPGVNFVGYFKAELGVAEVARKLVDAADAAGLPYSTITYGRTVSRQAHPFRERAVGALYATNVICVNADQLPVFADDVDAAFFSRRYSIGVWFWEIAEFPMRFQRALRLVDEVWVATEFVRSAVARVTDKPVHVVPLPISAPHLTPVSRSDLGLPEGFVFLFSFDFLSVAERKNPRGLIRAFSGAFQPGDGPLLVLKSINGDRCPSELSELRAAAKGRNDIVIWDGYVDADRRDALIAACDCYVSLHRSEGYGLTIAEAMALGKPVIVTGFSGNVDFTNAENSYLVPYRLVRVPPGCDPYPTTAEWAEPDIAEASRLMRDVYEHQDEARELGRRARDDVLRQFTVERTADFLRQRIAATTGAVSVEDDDEDGRGASPPLDELSDLVSRGPVAGFQHRTRFLIMEARTLVQRLLWRQLRHQHDINSAVLDALVELQRQVAQSQRLAQSHEKTAAHVAELTAAPYMADPNLFRQHDALGHTVLAFSERRGHNQQMLYREFEEIFRGSERFISERQRPYLELIRDHAPVLDVGCGRGEFLDLLGEAGVQARGIDIDQGMVNVSRGKGHDVVLADAISYLAGLEDASLGAIFTAQVVEHLPYPEFVRLLELSVEKLRPGGVFVAETVNPHALFAFKTFWVDPTHRNPIYPEVALAYACLSGFRSGRIVFPFVEGDYDQARLAAGEFALVASR